MDWRGSFVNCQPVFQREEIATLKANSTRVLVNTLKLAYNSFYNNVFMGSMDAKEHKELAMVFLNGLFCYLRGVGRLKDKESNRTVLPHFIANPILNALLESNLAQDDLIYLFCAQANLSLTKLSISPHLKIQPVIFEAFKQFNIQTIDFSNCNFVNDKTFLNLTQSESIQNSLASLKIRGCYNLKFLPNLSKFRSLVTLDISEIIDLELPGYQNNSLLDKLSILLNQLPSLRSLSTFSNGLLENSNSNLVSANISYKMWCKEVLLKSKLEYLDISVCSTYQLWISSSTVEDFLTYIILLPNLDSLDVSGWYITSQTFFNVFSCRKAFKFLGLLNIPALIDSNNFSYDVTYFADVVTSLSTHSQILNSLIAYLEKPQLLKLILRGIQNSFENNHISLDKDSVVSYMEALIKILNFFESGSLGTQLFISEDIVDNVISCLRFFTTQFSVLFPHTLAIRVMKNCFVLYRNSRNEKITEDLSKIISALITPEALKMEELYPFYFSMINFTLNVLRKCMSPVLNRFTGQARLLYRMASQHSEFLNMLTIELPRHYLTWVGYTNEGVATIANYIYSSVLWRMSPLGVHQCENLWGSLRNLVYLCPENCHEYLKYAKYFLQLGYHVARRKQWQEVINLIDQSLENVIECWILDIIMIEDIPALNCIEDFLLNKINYFTGNDDQYVCTFSSIMVYLARMFERSNKILPEYLRVGLELAAENLPHCDIVDRVKRQNLTALNECTLSKEENVVTCARWLINNYLQQDIEHYSRMVPFNEEALNPDVIIID